MSVGRSRHPGGLRLTDRAARLAGISAGMTLLDVGCGDGASLEFLAHKFGVIPYGIDKYVSTFTVGDAAELPYEDDFFDAVICECVLSLTRDAVQSIREMHRVLRPGGVLIVSDICGKNDIDGIEMMFLEAGFEVTHFEEHKAALITYAAEIQDAGDGVCGDIKNSTYYLLICQKR